MDTKSNHTPGPWMVAPEEVGLPLYVHSGDRHTCLTEVAVLYHTDDSGERDHANAKLIAAAPAMADALAEVDRWIDCSPGCEAARNGGFCTCGAEGIHVQVASALRAAGRLP